MKKLLPYQAGNAKDHLAVGEFLRGLKAGDQFIIQISTNRPTRSNEQNAYYHVVLAIYSTAINCDKEDFEYDFKMARHYKEIVTDDGEVKRYPAKTAKLDTKEFAAMMNNLLDFGREHFPEVIVPPPPVKGQADYIHWMQIENDYDDARSGF